MPWHRVPLVKRPEGERHVDEAGLVLSQKWADRYPNLTIKKIPRAVLARCEWSHDDYSLRVDNLPKAPPPEGQMSLFDEYTS